jgi:hypothetical protein
MLKFIAGILGAISLIYLWISIPPAISYLASSKAFLQVDKERNWPHNLIIALGFGILSAVLFRISMRHSKNSEKQNDL